MGIPRYAGITGIGRAVQVLGLDNFKENKKYDSKNPNVDLEFF
jgi:hypothetical protein